MNFTLHQLQVFLKVTQTRSITKASEELCLSQPAVSIQLKNFQDQFDIPLTEVISRKLYITDFGREMAIAAERILNEVSQVSQKTLDFRGKLSGRLKCTSVSTGKYILPYFMSGFVKQHEGIELFLDVTNKAKVLNSLESNEVDFALISVPPSHLHFQKVDLLRNKLFLVSNRHFKMTGKVMDKKVLESMPLIYREPGSGTRQMMEQFIQKSKVPVRKKMELTSNEAVKHAVIAGLGLSVMPLIGLKNELTNGDIQIVPMKGFPMQTNWSLIWLKNKKFSPVAKAFLDYINKEREQIIHKHFNWYENY